MKGSTGLIVAVFLGLAGALLNWFYLDSKTRDIKNMSFVGIRDGITIKAGDAVRADQLEEIPIPERFGRKLQNVVYLWKDVATIEGLRTSRAIEGGQLFFRELAMTAPRDLSLAPGEEHFVITVDTNNIEPELINPGDSISFMVPGPGSVVRSEPTPAGLTGEGIERIGPFRVKSLGNRLGSIDASRGARTSAGRENKIGIVYKKTDPAEKLQFEKLVRRIGQGDSRTLLVVLESRGG